MAKCRHHRGGYSSHLPMPYHARSSTNGLGGFGRLSAGQPGRMCLNHGGTGALPIPPVTGGPEQCLGSAHLSIDGVQPAGELEEGDAGLQQHLLLHQAPGFPLPARGALPVTGCAHLQAAVYQRLQRRQWSRPDIDILRSTLVQMPSFLLLTVPQVCYTLLRDTLRAACVTELRCTGARMCFL